MSKEELEEKQEQRNAKYLAKLLGISYEDLTALTYEIHDEASDEGLIYGHRVVFDKTASKDILKKIKNLDSNNTVYLLAGSFGE